MSTSPEQDEFSWNLLYQFLTITRHESFTAAALALGVSRPAVSQTIRRLERQLDLQLVQRQPGNRFFSLTAKGEELRQLALSVELGLRRLRGESIVASSQPTRVTPLEQAQEIQRAMLVLLDLLREQS